MKITLAKLIGVAVALALIGGMLLYWHRQAAGVQQESRFLMDTYCTIRVPNAPGARAAIARAFERMADIDRRFNALNPRSPVYRFNVDGAPIADPDIADVIRMALHVAERTSGAFDITVQPLMELWGFNTPAPAVPDRAQIEERRRSVNWRNLAIEHGQVVRRNAATRIDLGGIAKGYAVAEAVRVLKDAGIRSALVDAGGDIYAFGRTGGRPWRVGIRNPRGEGIIGVLDLCEQSLATSGDYERCFERDGVRYHHILDPATGYPAGGVVSVTVLSSNATLADAWSTALFVLSAQRGLECAEAVPDVDALIVTSEGKRLYTSGLRDRIRAPAPPP